MTDYQTNILLIIIAILATIAFSLILIVAILEVKDYMYFRKNGHYK